jgi:hypothetical protein
MAAALATVTRPWCTTRIGSPIASSAASTGRSPFATGSSARWSGVSSGMVAMMTTSAVAPAIAASAVCQSWPERMKTTTPVATAMAKASQVRSGISSITPHAIANRGRDGQWLRCGVPLRNSRGAAR